jgi:hypothetical protein
MKVEIQSPFEYAVSVPVYTARAHFHGAVEVWDAYARGQISQKRREELLSVLRGRLAREVFLPA